MRGGRAKTKKQNKKTKKQNNYKYLSSSIYMNTPLNKTLKTPKQMGGGLK